MSNLEKLNNYIDHLQREKSATRLVNDADNEELTRAMKSARDIHTHSTDKKPDPFFVNALEEEILIMNEEGRKMRIRRSWIWSIVPTLGVAALAVVITVGIMQPEADKNIGTQEGSVVTSQAQINPQTDEPLELSPVPVVVTSGELQEFETLASQMESYMNETDRSFRELDGLANDPTLASSVSQIEVASF